ncbi:MAG: polymer-forming cytoskeletal protein [Bryobacterales bacterium]|nr:polymer-forming cytoskeletal protein [Bryobacterales bacterium]
MWGQKEKESSTETDMPGTGQALSPAGSAPLPASSAVVHPAAERDPWEQVRTRFGKNFRFNGEMTGSEDVYVAGEIEGSIELSDNELIVGSSGDVRGQVKARAITVSGHLKGEVRAEERIEIQKTGSLEGDLETAQIVIEDGAMFRGSIDLLEPEQSENALLRGSEPPLSQPPAAAESDPPIVSLEDSTDG